MVYESDFYTTRRPYSRPLASSYSVTSTPVVLPLSAIIQYFDDEAKEIRARVDSLLRRVHVFVPRASPSDFAEEIIPERMRSGDYVHRLISGKNNAKKDADAVSWYDVPERGNFGNLACVKYVAGKPQSVRRPYYKVADLRPSDIKNDVNFLSYYQKNRQAAANALKQEKLDAIKRAEEYLRKAEEEARTEEERRAAAEQERLRLEMEEQKAWEALQIDVERKAHLDEILEQEKALAERKAEEERLETERAEVERLETAERLLNAEKLKALMEEQERMLIEERAEEVRQRQEREERLAEVARGENGEIKDRDCSREDHLMNELTDQEMEEKPYEVTTDDDTRIEEENVVEDEVEDIPVDTFVEEPQGAESRPVLATGGTAIEDVFASTQEETFEWPKDEDA